MKKTTEEIVFNIVSLTITTLFALACIVPILLTLSGSLTDEMEIYNGLKLWPAKFSTVAYQTIMQTPNKMLQAYKITILMVIIGTTLAIFSVSIAAYVLYRKDFKYRTAITFYFFFTTLFSGGAVPAYILHCAIGLRDNFITLIASGFFSAMNIIIVRTYFTSNVPLSLVESAKIDGANDFRIYTSIVLPAAIPILATQGLLTALSYWNGWSTAKVYISKSSLYPLQYYLYKVFETAQLQQALAEQGLANNMEVPKESYKMAMTVFTMGPVVLFYPFIQKYFVSGLTIGAVKG